MGTDLKKLQQALQTDWIDADAGPGKYLRGILEKIARGEGVVLEDNQSATQASPAPPGKILIPTGGTTGRPRHTIHTWKTLSAAAENLAARIGGPIHGCCILPLHHVSGFMQVARALVTGGKVVFPDPGNPEVEPDGLCLSLVPTQLKRFLEKPGMTGWLQRFRMIFLGGAAAHENLLNEARKQRLPLAPCYGMTETAAMVTLLEPQDFLEGMTGCGKPLPNVQVQVKDGCIRIQSPSLCEGYQPDGPTIGPWLETRDTGTLDKDGSLHVTGRLDRIIITGGEKVDPAEVEAALLKTPGVQEALVAGVDDSEWGQRVTAFIVGETQGLDEKLRQQMHAHKVPKNYIKVDAIPLNENGKVDWNIIRSLLEQTTQ